VGIIVPKHKQSAVARNRVKRRLRELVRLTLLPALRARSPLDVVLRAAPSAYGAAYADLAADVSRLTQRLEAVG
jgi:ribonuclease P protein component